MLLLPQNIKPTQAALDKLAEFQQAVYAAGSYALQVEAAKQHFKAKNVKRNGTFRAVKKALTDMCSGARRCVYCEDSVGDEVEHIYPKDFYPNLVFVWENYLYACGNCNGPKSNRFEIFDPLTLAVVDLKITAPTEIPVGAALLINPRVESGMDYMMLDLEDTFMFVPLPNQSTTNQQRAERTIEILHLSDRDFLQEARRNAFNSYKAQLFEYVHSKALGANPDKLEAMINNIRRASHPSVWFEMKRYFQNGWLPKIDEELQQLFEKAIVDDVLNW
ncbi:MAG: hypothetical protein IPN76_19900 [Saprospiraceae bacterium]|nr:hypothetical protein [Saprospiraceae bacterium]